ncbi:TPA: DoxX family protein [Stenotrophomonas maltophilia]|uniref:DoxX family protein n=1 Tax=Cupriavidus pauculus TaxID=82633 RepID=UPI0007806125|nr:DoxX family protein [Cupriavidus pauculus]HDS1530789.1 DoxX family protein [Stenotrophomonas maltophilia]
MARKYTYWISTSLLCLLYLASATFYATQGDAVRQALAALGYPGYLVPILMTVKVLGVLAILSRVNVKLSDLAYAGMFYHLLLAMSAHLHAGDYAGLPPATIGFLLLLTSFLTQNAARKTKTPNSLA